MEPNRPLNRCQINESTRSLHTSRCLHLSPIYEIKNPSFMPKLDSFWKGRNAGNNSFLSTGSWKLSIPTFPIFILPIASVLHQMMSPCENFLFYWRPIGRLLDWVESLPTHKGSDSSESPNGGGEKILIESSTVLNSEKDFSKFDQIDRESHHLLGGPTDRVGLGVHVTEPFSSQESHYWSNRDGSNSLANEKSIVLTLRKKT